MGNKLIDDVIIGNTYATEEELQALSQINPYIIELDIDICNKLSQAEHSILLDTLHIRRGDISEYMIRSTGIRTKHINSNIPILNSPDQICGDIYIGNNSFGKYKGELQIIIKDMPFDLRKNKVAAIKNHDKNLLN